MFRGNRRSRGAILTAEKIVLGAKRNRAFFPFWQNPTNANKNALEFDSKNFGI